MSRDSQHSFRNPSRNSLPPTKNRRDYYREVEKLSVQLKRLSDTILPPQPYLLSVPSDVPYRHSSRFVNTWHIGTPFAQEEEQLQYMSFLPHQDVGEELLHVVGGWSDEKGNMLEESDESPQNLPTNGRNTPFESERKKISLNDYKTKAKGSDPDSVAIAEQPRDLSKQSEKVSGIAVGVQHASKQESPIGKKRPRDEPMNIANMDGPSSPVENPSSIQESAESPRPGKRPRVVSPSLEDGPTKDLKSNESYLEKPVALPGLLSPTLPSPEKDRQVPELVSPTLPPSILTFLTSQTPNSHTEGSLDHSRTDSVRSILASAGLGLSPNSGPRHSPKPSTLHAGHVRSDSQHSVRSNISATSGVHGAASPGLRGSVKTPHRPGTPVQNGIRASPGPRQRHIIALKYGKKNRKRVEGLLKFAPRPKKSEARRVLPAKHEFTATTNKTSNNDESHRQKKRPLEESPEITAKRQKPPPASLNLAEKPSTPVSAAFKSPSAHASTSKPKSVFSTPKKDLKSSAMQRVVSSDGIDVRTPPGDRTSLSTPLSTERSAANTKLSPPPTSAPTSKDDRAAWQNLNSKYFALGRTIKREATAILQNGEPSPEDSALSVVLLIEGLLCFMINLAAISHTQHGADPGWMTIVPYHIFVFRSARPFPHLHGLVVQLGAVCRQLIHKYDMDRLARDPLPDEQVGSAPTPGSDGNTKTNEDGEKYKKKYLEFRDQLVRNSKELQTAWMDGSRELSLDTLEREYPRTWKKRAKDTTLRGVMRLNPSRISEDFFLPLDANATAFEGVRFAMAFLAEWTEKEKIEWKARVEI